MRIGRLVRTLGLPVRTVLMSHGNQSGDDLRDIVEERRRGLAYVRHALTLGMNLVVESEHRDVLDAVCVMSEEERILEHWLGAGKTMVRRVFSAAVPSGGHLSRVAWAIRER